jgi:hypothetical protein
MADESESHVTSMVKTGVTDAIGNIINKPETGIVHLSEVLTKKKNTKNIQQVV